MVKTWPGPPMPFAPSVAMRRTGKSSGAHYLTALPFPSQVSGTVLTSGTLSTTVITSYKRRGEEVSNDVATETCDYPGCLCSSPECPCHDQHPAQVEKWQYDALLKDLREVNERAVRFGNALNEVIESSSGTVAADIARDALRGREAEGVPTIAGGWVGPVVHSERLEPEHMDGVSVPYEGDGLYDEGPSEEGPGAAG